MFVVVVSVVVVLTIVLYIGRRLVLLEMGRIRSLVRNLFGSFVRRLVGQWDLLDWKANFLLKGIIMMELECVDLSLELLNSGLHGNGVIDVGHLCLILDLSCIIRFRIFVIVGRVLLDQG